MTYDQALSWLPALLVWLIFTSILWKRDETEAFANERKAREEGQIR